MLSPQDKQKLIDYALNTLKQNMTLELTNTINGYAKLYDNLAEAKKALRLKFKGPAIFNNVQIIQQHWPNSLMPWLPSQDVPTLLRTVAVVGMSASASQKATSTKYILATQSIMGCLGVAAFGDEVAFLAHWLPSQLANESIAQRVKDIDEAVGTDAIVYLSSPSMQQGAPYITVTRDAVLKTHQIGGAFNSQRLAINAKTGAVLTDFSVEGLLND